MKREKCNLQTEDKSHEYINGLIHKYTFNKIDFNNHKISNISLEPLKLFIYYICPTNSQSLIDKIELLYNKNSTELFLDFCEKTQEESIQKIKTNNILLFKKEWISNNQDFVDQQPIKLIKKKIKNKR